jgi:hypothetical protein
MRTKLQNTPSGPNQITPSGIFHKLHLLRVFFAGPSFPRSTAGVYSVGHTMRVEPQVTQLSGGTQAFVFMI